MHAQTRILAFAIVLALGLSGMHRADAAPIYTLPFAVTDMEVDAARGRMYVSDKGGKRVAFVDLATGDATHSFTFTTMPERMALSPDGSRLYVALLTREHSPYWWDEDGHTGFVAEFDLDAGTKLREIAINEDPYDLVVTPSGKLVVASGSGQWTYIRAYDVTSGVELGSAGIRQMSRLALHPGGQWVYAANTDVSPSDIQKFDVSGAGITALYDSPYHGDHRMSGNVYASPRGDVLITRGGDVFRATAERATDMTYLQGLSAGTITHLAFDGNEGLVFTVEGNTLGHYNLLSLERFGQTTLARAGSFVAVDTSFVYVLESAGATTEVERFAHPCPDCGENTAPQAVFSVDPPSGGDTQTTYTFDASASSDLEDDPSALAYRWDWDANGTWDTAFAAANKIVTHRFNIAGTKHVALQVRDSQGLLSSTQRTLEVAQGQDPGTPGGGGTAFELPCDATDVETDAARGKMYVSSKGSRRVFFVDLATGLVQKYFEFATMPERMALSPDGSRLYVALLTREHDYYWWDEDGHQGFIAEFDLDAGVKTREFAINEDPYDLVVAASGKLVVAGGSGQWTYIRAYDVATGVELGSAGIRQMSRLALHPGGQWVYAANTDLSPSDIQKFDVSGAGITALYDSPYHGDHRMSGNVYASPRGDVLITRGGDVFRATAERATDMTYLRGLSAGTITHLAFDGSEGLIFAVEGSTLGHYNLSSLEKFGQTTLAQAGSFVAVDASFVYVLESAGGTTRIQRFAHPCPDCGENTAPNAAFSVDPAAGGDTETTYTFDASASSDLEDDPSALAFRWDWDANGTWDTDFLAGNRVVSHRFTIAGTKYVSLQVRDSKGLLSSTQRTVEVAQGQDPGTPGGGGTAFELPCDATDMEMDAARGKMYVSSKGSKRVFFVDLATGFVEKYFDFTTMPERMALSPDGSRLYVALLTREHDSSWWDEDGHQGFIAEFDLDAGVKTREFAINEDPYDLVVNAAGKLAVASGSGQWTHIRAYDVATGAELGSAGIRQRSRLALHPNGEWVYAADTDLSPSDIEKFDIGRPGIVALYDSPYHGDHRMAGNVYASPRGDLLVTRGGDVFRATADQATDMTYVRGLAAGAINHLAFDATGAKVIFTVEGAMLRTYRLATQALLKETALKGTGSFIGADGAAVYVLEVAAGKTYVERLPYPVDYLLFRESFADGDQFGDPDWRETAGNWGVTATKQYASAANQVCRAVVQSSPRLERFPWGSLQVKMLLRAGSTDANGALVFGYVDEANYRYILVSSDGRQNLVRIGQKGDPGGFGVQPGVKRAARVALTPGAWNRFTVDIAPGGLVRVYVNGSALPAVSYNFGNVVPGGLGLQALKSRTLFDDVIFRRLPAHP